MTTRVRSAGKAAGALVALAALAACGGSKEDAIAPPLEPPSYGEEEANPEVFLDSMEVGSRELYAARDAVVAALGLKPGMRIADIGSGTGLYALMFADRVGADGVVYAIDIEPMFLKLINTRVADLDLHNVVAVLSREDDITLPPGYVDAVFIADTYHYFSEPNKVLASINSALATGGRLFILDYRLTDENRSNADYAHVRFGMDGLVAEVEAAGFRLVGSPEVEGLADIYLAIFEKSPAGG